MNHETTAAGLLNATESKPRTLISNRTKGKVLLFVYMTSTFILTHIKLKGTLLDHHNFPSDFQIVDKLYHFVAYFGLTFLVLFCLTKHPKKKPNAVVRVESARTMMMWCFFIVLYGLIDELTQPYFGRRFELLDLLANIVGISFAQAAFVMSEATGVRRRLLDWG